ncbi:MAG: AAA family ATPase [Caulobacteraceae bacterium]
MRFALLFIVLALAAPAHAEEAATPRECLAAFASRYVGETERNLDRVFRPAEHLDVALSYDEADALFGRSEDSEDHGRYANQEVAYLLARIERHANVEHLTSNLRRTIAAGFDRRARYAGIVVIETETGVRAIEFARADRRRALAYTEASLEACPAEAR